MQNEDPNAFGGPLMNIEDKIKLFAELPGDERREVEQYVAKHGDEQPRLRELLRESKRLEQLLESARALGSDPPGDEAIALYVVMRGVDPSRMPSELAEAFDDIRRHVERDPELQAKVRAFEGRGEELSAASDAERRFADLIGSERSSHRAEDRRAMPHREAGPSRSGRKVRNVAGAAIVVAALYAILFVVGRFTQPPHEQLANFSADELVLEGYEEVRGGVGPATTSPTAAYVQALTYLQDAQASFLGLFPHFRVTPLDSAAVALREVIAAEPNDSFLANEATYFLGKTELARGNIEAAREALQRVATTPGVRAEDARLLLQEVEEL